MPRIAAIFLAIVLLVFLPVIIPVVALLDRAYRKRLRGRRLRVCAPFVRRHSGT